MTTGVHRFITRSARLALVRSRRRHRLASSAGSAGAQRGRSRGISRPVAPSIAIGGTPSSRLRIATPWSPAIASLRSASHCERDAAARRARAPVTLPVAASATNAAVLTAPGGAVIVELRDEREVRAIGRPRRRCCRRSGPGSAPTTTRFERADPDRARERLVVPVGGDVRRQRVQARRALGGDLEPRPARPRGPAPASAMQLAVVVELAPQPCGAPVPIQKPVGGCAL